MPIRAVWRGHSSRVNLPPAGRPRAGGRRSSCRRHSARLADGPAARRGDSLTCPHLRWPMRLTVGEHGTKQAGVAKEMQIADVVLAHVGLPSSAHLAGFALVVE